MTRKRKLPADRQVEILRAALDEALLHGYREVTREGVALRADCSPALISVYFGTMKEFRRAIMSAAIAQKNLPVIAQGLALRDSKALAAPAALRSAAVRCLA